MNTDQHIKHYETMRYALCVTMRNNAGEPEPIDREQLKTELTNTINALWSLKQIMERLPERKIVSVCDNPDCLWHKALVKEGSHYAERFDPDSDTPDTTPIHYFDAGHQLCSECNAKHKALKPMERALKAVEFVGTKNKPEDDR